MSNSSFQSEIPKARINLKLDLHTGGASKKTELPLKLLVAGDFSNGQESAPLSERKKVNLNKNNFDSVLSEYSPKVNLTVKNTLAGDGAGTPGECRSTGGNTQSGKKMEILRCRDVYHAGGKHSHTMELAVS